MALTTLLLAPAAAVLLICAVTRLWTTLRYRLELGRSDDLREPPHLPYTVPWLGTARDFLDRRPGGFYTKLFRWHPRREGACTVVLGGQTMHLVNSPSTVQAMFRLKTNVANRDAFNKIVTGHVNGMSDKDWVRYEKVVHKDHQLMIEYLLRPSHASEMAREYVRFFSAALRVEARGATKDRRQVDLYDWLYPVVFGASTTGFMGEHVGRVYPDFARDFREWDRGFLDVMFGFPRLLKPAAYAARARCHEGLERWVLSADRADDEAGGMSDGADPSEPGWEPRWGSRVMRLRQEAWKSVGMSVHARACMELGFTFGLASNAIPIIGWMLMHILDPAQPGLLARVRAEAEACATTDQDGEVKIDIQKLGAQPLVQSLFQETLRRYVDVLVLRDLFEDVKLPCDDESGAGKEKKGDRRWLLFRKGSQIVAPALMNSMDTAHFASPPADVFYPDRFLVPAPPSSEEEGDGAKGEEKQGGGKDGKAEYVFSTQADGAKMWPWGGGKTMCPGRLFAKQEVLASVALVLLTFDIEPADKETYRIPAPADARPGSGGMVPGGDVKVMVRPRSRK